MLSRGWRCGTQGLDDYRRCKGRRPRRLGQALRGSAVTAQWDSCSPGPGYQRERERDAVSELGSKRTDCNKLTQEPKGTFVPELWTHPNHSQQRTHLHTINQCRGHRYPANQSRGHPTSHQSEQRTPTTPPNRAEDLKEFHQSRNRSHPHSNYLLSASSHCQALKVIPPITAQENPTAIQSQHRTPGCSKTPLLPSNALTSIPSARAQDIYRLCTNHSKRHAHTPPVKGPS